MILLLQSLAILIFQQQPSRLPLRQKITQLTLSIWKESKEDKESTIVGGNIYLGASIPKLEVKDSDIDSWAEAVSPVLLHVKSDEIEKLKKRVLKIEKVR